MRRRALLARKKQPVLRFGCYIPKVRIEQEEEYVEENIAKALDAPWAIVRETEKMGAAG